MNKVLNKTESRSGQASTQVEKLALAEFKEVLDSHHIISHKLRSKEADVFRFLRTQILQAMSKHGFKTLAISSPRYGDGKSTIAANLCVSIAQDLKQTVLLVDVDLRSPSLSEFLGVTPEKGLTDYLVGDAQVEDCLIRTPFNRFSLFPAGTAIEQSSETLGSPQMEKLADELKARYNDRLIVYDMPPLLEQDDPLVFLPHVDCFLLVVRVGVTTTDEIKRSLDILESAQVIGVALNSVD
jgi:capsular exopolysaccharide synthesis family protein